MELRRCCLACLTIAGVAVSTPVIAADVPSKDRGESRPPAISQPVEFHTPEADAILSKLQVFPADHALNQSIEQWPRHPQSKEIVASIGVDKPLRGNTDMGFILVPPDQPRVDVKIVEYPDESDPGPFPVPGNVPIEGWPVWHQRESATPPTLETVQRRPAKYEGDRHAIIVDPVNMRLYEFFTFGKTCLLYTSPSPRD